MSCHSFARGSLCMDHCAASRVICFFERCCHTDVHWLHGLSAVTLTISTRPVVSARQLHHSCRCCLVWNMFVHNLTWLRVSVSVFLTLSPKDFAVDLCCPVEALASAHMPLCGTLVSLCFQFCCSMSPQHWLAHMLNVTCGLRIQLMK